MNARTLPAAAALSFAFPFAAPGQGPPVVADGHTVAITYTLTLDDGSHVGSNVGKEPLVYRQGSGQLLARLEAALAGLGVGDRKTVRLTVEDAYGAVDPAATAEVPIERLPPKALTRGAVLVVRDQAGNQRHVRVAEVKADTVVIDLNHPLAGKALTFEVEVVSIE